MSELALRRIAENKKTKKTSLDLMNCGITVVPDEIGELEWLERLDLSHDTSYSPGTKKSFNIIIGIRGEDNKITSLGKGISLLKNLKYLSISYQRGLNDIEPLAGLSNLEYLSLNNTQLSDLTPLARLRNLEFLYLDYNNQLSDLSPLSKLTKLWHLSIRSTYVADLSPIAGLTKLKEIYCNNTPISDLSQINWKPFVKLQIFDLTNTKITDLLPLRPLIDEGLRISDEYLFSHDNNVILVGGCPIANPPLEILKRGNRSVLKYFEELSIAEKKNEIVHSAEIKCLIIGEGGAGKTSLTLKLLDQNNPLPKEGETTNGIAVYPLDWPLTDGKNFRLNIWDFGGQEIYHTLHQFFLTKRSLYILLDDTRKGELSANDQTFNYWLQQAQLFGGGSPLLIVQNEKGDRSKQLDLQHIQTKFNFVKDVVATNLQSCRGMENVRKAIEYLAKQLPHVNETQPKSWVDIRRELERLAREDKRDYISIEEYYRICTEYGIYDHERMLFLSSYLHDVGVILHFQNHPLLSKTIILNNQWVTGAVYKILNSEKVKKNFGQFTRSELASFWIDERYDDKHHDLLALMENFELCYKLLDKKEETWLAPQLFSVQRPNGFIWEEEGNLQMHFEYEFMPKGLLSQHIVRMHRYVKQPELMWKTGVVLERNGTQALIREAWGGRKISIKVKGSQPKDLLTLINEDFDKLHERLEGLRVKKMIPCICSICSEAIEPHFYEHVDLVKRKENGKPTVECPISYDYISVIGLLDGIFSTLREDNEINKSKELKIIKIFLASSSELLEDRNQFEIFISRKNKSLIKKGLFFELLRWEDFLDALSATRLQDEYNKSLLTCDIVVCLFYTKVGKYTAEEFDMSLGQFRKTGMPKIYTYFKDVPVKPSVLQEFQTVLEFKDRLTILGHFPYHYESIGDLKDHFGDQLKHLGYAI